MELLSLPEEMLASVSKYANFGTLTRVRKMNQQVNLASCRYGVNKPRIDNIHIGKARGGISLFCIPSKTFEVEIDQSDLFRGFKIHLIQNETDNRLMMLEKYLKMVRCANIEISRILLDNELLILLNKFKADKSQRCGITIFHCNLTASPDELSKALSKFSPCRLWMNNSNTTLDGSYRNDKVILPLLSVLSELRIGNVPEDTTPAPDVTDETLRALRKFRPSAFSLQSSQCHFSAEEVHETVMMAGQLIEECEIDYWNLGHIKMNSRAELNQTIEILQTIPTTEIERTDNSTKVALKGAREGRAVLIHAGYPRGEFNFRPAELITLDHNH